MEPSKRQTVEKALFRVFKMDRSYINEFLKGEPHAIDKFFQLATVSAITEIAQFLPPISKNQLCIMLQKLVDMKRAELQLMELLNAMTRRAKEAGTIKPEPKEETTP